MPFASIVLADSNPTIAEAAIRKLAISGHSVRRAENACGAMSLLRDSKSELIIVDFNLPDVVGLDLLREIKNDPRLHSVRVLMTSPNGHRDAVEALEAGADDYLPKPYSLDELNARVATALRRPPVSRVIETTERVGSILVDDVSCQVTANGSPVDLSPLEYRLLSFLIRNPGRMFTRGQLISNVWHDVECVHARTVDVNVRRLRSRLAEQGCDRYIQTVRGKGYRLQAQYS
ncbi:MAG: winged helix-turn-helix domain-containing protein [Pseudomonadota bacterium]